VTEANPPVERPENVIAANFGPAAVAPGAVSPQQPQLPSAFEAEEPEILTKLSAREKAVWHYLVEALKRYCLIHKTDAPLLTIIVRIFVQWCDAEQQLQAHAKANDGSFMTKTPNGFEQPHQLYYVARDLKRQLLQWLPEAALTIPSFTKLTGGDAAPLTPDMFEDPVVAFRNRKQALNDGTSGAQG
jgi:phage terminase small subunit